MERTIARILVPTDFSAVSAAAIDHAVRIALRFGASLHLLHVLDNPFVAGPAWEAEAWIGSVPAIHHTLIDEAAAKLSAVVRRLEHRGVPARAEIRVGRTADTIREVARSEACDLIVMGTHGRTGVAHLLLGSIAERTMRKSECPVLAVRALHRRVARKRQLGEGALARTV